MNNQYSVSEILECIDNINSVEKKFDKYDYKTFTSFKNTNLKKNIEHTQGTFGEPFETEEMVEEILDDAEPFEIEEITKIDNSDTEKKKTDCNAI